MTLFTKTIEKGIILRLIDGLDEGEVFVAIETNTCPYCVSIHDYNSEYTVRDYLKRCKDVSVLKNYEVERIGKMF